MMFSDDDWGSKHESSLHDLWRRYRVESLLVLSVVLSLIFFPWINHPGLHLAGVTVLLDLLFIGGGRLRSWLHLLILIVMNLVALLVIAVGKDPTELWFTGLYGFYAILLIAFSRRNSAR